MISVIQSQTKNLTKSSREMLSKFVHKMVANPLLFLNSEFDTSVFRRPPQTRDRAQKIRWRQGTGLKKTRLLLT
jgi:hypothetical protein